MIIKMMGLLAPSKNAMKRMTQMVTHGLPCMSLLPSSLLASQLNAPVVMAMPMTPMHRIRAITVVLPNEPAMTRSKPIDVMPRPNKATILGQSMSIVIQPYTAPTKQPRMPMPSGVMPAKPGTN